jgi:hypothetical protein
MASFTLTGWAAAWRGQGAHARGAGKVSGHALAISHWSSHAVGMAPFWVEKGWDPLQGPGSGEAPAARAANMLQV